MNSYVRDVDDASFAADVIEASHAHPVLADFWASWCAPCRTLGPVLESLADEYGGAFTLAKIDADANGELAARFGVRGLPTVKLFRDGEVVDEFVGALPEADVRRFIDQHMTTAADRLLSEALELAKGNPQAGIELLKRGIELEPDKHQLHLALARLYIDQKSMDDAQALLNGLPPKVATSDEAVQLGAQVRIAGLCPDTLDESDPQSPRLKAAIAHVEAHEYDAALTQLAEILKTDPDWQDGYARRLMLDVLGLPGIDPPAAARWRRRLATLLN